MRIELAGYKINNDPLYNGPHTLVFHAIKNNTQHPVIIKILKNEHPSFKEIVRFRTECNITNSFSNDEVVHVEEILPHQNSNALVLENIAGPTLAEMLMTNGSFTISNFLTHAISLVNIIHTIHQHHIIHKDINPTNLIFDEKNKCFKIIDFGVSVTLSTEKTIANTNILEGTLAYLSPEQTGRMNRGIDYRSDYYSLGMVFYHMITGRPAFEKEDALDYIHAQIAVLPTEPHKINSEIPVVLSKLIMKLIEKEAEKRYQSYHGLIHDLVKCKKQWEKSHQIEDFILAEKETYSQFKIPEKLYGRQEQINLLMNKYDQMTGGKIQLVFVSGYSGIGKTALINEIQKPIAKSHGYFISGKFEQFKHNIPYGAFIQAFNNLFEQMLSESENKIEEFKSVLISELKDNISVLSELLPHLKNIVGHTSLSTSLGPIEKQNRLSYSFLKLIEIIAKKEHPLTLFLDDLQWADLASLKIIQTLLIHEKDIHLMIIGSYRSNEVDESHPLQIIFHDFKERNISYDHIKLSPLNLSDIEELIMDLFHEDKPKIKKLAQLAYDKTGGNPFFLNQWLQLLYKEKEILFNFDKNKWSWSLDSIKNRFIMDNIADVISKRIYELSLDIQKIIKIASCIGTQFKSKQVSDLLNEKEDLIIERLDVLLEIELLFLVKKEQDIFYQFSHDKIEKVVYELLDNKEKKELHLMIAQYFCQKIIDKNDKDLIFEITNQYSKAIHYGALKIISMDEIKKIIEMNVCAIQFAKEACAYDQGLKYFQKCLQCVSPELWSTNHDLILNLYYGGIDTANLLGQFDLMENYYDTAIPHVKNIFEKIKIQKIKILSYVVRSRHAEAINLVLSILQELGLNIPPKPSKVYIISLLLKIKFLMIGKSIKSLVNLPAMKDPKKIEMVRLLTSMLPSAYSHNPDLLPALVFHNIILSLKYGNTKESAVAYTSYGVMLCGILYDMKDGYDFGDLGLSLINKLGVNYERAKITFLNYGFVKYWIDDIQSTFPKLIENYHRGIENGEVEYAAYSIMGYAINAFLAGVPLTEYCETMDIYLTAIKKLNQINAYSYILLNYQIVLNLINEKLFPEVIVGKLYNENEKLPVYFNMHDKTSLFFLGVNKLAILYFFNRCRQNKDDIYLYINLCNKNIDGVIGSFTIVTYYFYRCLCLFDIFNDEKFKNKLKIFFIIQKSYHLMKRWARYNPCYESKFLLIKAIMAEIFNKNSNKILRLYEKAMISAKKYHILSEQAITSHLLAKFYLKQNNEKIAQIYLNDAKYYYELWGATAVVKCFDETYKNIYANTHTMRTNKEGKTFLANIGFTTTTETMNTDSLDIYTIQRSSAIISSTIELKVLLKKLMTIVIESAGAQYCCLLIKSENEYTIEAEKYSNQKQVTSLKSKKPNNDILPMMLINYVINKKTMLLFDNIFKDENRYSLDPYIVKNHNKSVLCVPLLNKGDLTGILYLENNLTAHAFTKKHVNILNLLSSQIAISIDNARLYSKLKKSNRKLNLLNASYERFIPRNFLSLLSKKNITEVDLGDQARQYMTVLFIDIRQFTTISEKISPEENILFINRLLSYMEPVISRFNGFIDKYIGDAIMALFPTNEDDAVQCAIAIIKSLQKYNDENKSVNREKIRIGIGINSGFLTLGTVGNKHRMDVTVISDIVNVASRVESQTKEYNKEILITEHVYNHLKNPTKYFIQEVDTVILRGKTSAIKLYSVDAKW